MERQAWPAADFRAPAGKAGESASRELSHAMRCSELAQSAERMQVRSSLAQSGGRGATLAARSPSSVGRLS